MKVERQTESSARYIVTWRGIRRDRDREYAISGGEWIAFDRASNEVLGVLRDFFLSGSVRNRSGIYWMIAGQCPFKRKLLGRGGDLFDAAAWSPLVLRPSVYPGRLKFLDDQKRDARK